MEPTTHEQVFQAMTVYILERLATLATNPRDVESQHRGDELHRLMQITDRAFIAAVAKREAEEVRP